MRANANADGQRPDSAGANAASAVPAGASTVRLTASVLGDGGVPPVKCTSCTPVTSLPLIDQVASRKLVPVGLNVTRSVSVWPAAIVVPSGSVVAALKSPPTGGLERVMATGVCPALVIVNVRDRVRPTATLPNAFSSSWITRRPGLPA